MTYSDKPPLRHDFLLGCHPETQEIHWPILDLFETAGHLNPGVFGAQGPAGQSTVAFEDQASLEQAQETGHSIYGGSEYGIAGTAESQRVCKKIAALHGGAGAVILPSGLGAIKETLDTFLGGENNAILIPDNRYFPTERALNQLKRHNTTLAVYPYQNDQDIIEIIKRAESEGKTVRMIYLEAPGSQTFEIPDIEQIISIAKARNILTVMDNTWASHVRFKPIQWGADIVIQATTKYESGGADTPSGVVIAANEEHLKALANTVRANGVGAVSPLICNQLFHRIVSTEERMNQHYESALKIISWFKQQRFVEKILCPFDSNSPDYERFKTYFKKGNGLFTLVFKANVDEEKVNQFLDALLLFRTGESWGGHVSLALKAHPSRTLSEPPKGIMTRFSIGLEHPDDLIRDLMQSQKRVFPFQITSTRFKPPRIGLPNINPSIAA